MKILFFANRIPYPPYRGDKLKIYNLAKRLQHHELHLLTFAQSKEEYQYLAELEKIFTKVHLVYLPKWKSALNCIPGLWKDVPLQVLYFESAEMRSKLAEVLQQDTFDAIHVQHLRMSPYLDKREELPRILDMPDAFSLYWQRRKQMQTNPAKKVFEHIEQQRVARYEYKMLERYNMSLVCSQEDLDYLKNKNGVGDIRLLPNGVDLDTFKAGDHDYSHNHTLLFTGNMDYAPNVDAVGYFVKEVLPLIHNKYPNTQFIIAGQRPLKKVQDLASDKIKVTGFIKDLAAVYNEASVVVAPLRFGAGTQNKVLEAMAMGVPVVCSNIGFKGLGIQSGEGAIMQTDPAEFAQSVVDLLSSENMRRSVGEKGVNVMHARFGWDAIAKQLEKYLKEIARQ
ncbi:MAG: glycosyltransferase [Sphingobacteriales bacterium]|nr:MAG: glycosyltransferase [Sphingobacteriales bacterium]